MQEERRLFRLKGIAIVALAAKFTQKRTVTKECTPDVIRVPVAHRPVVGFGVLAVRAALRLNMLVVAKRVSHLKKFAVTAKAGLVQTQRLVVANAVVIRIVVAEGVA